MGDFLRDSRVVFLTIGEVELDQVNADLMAILTRANSAAADPQGHVGLTYILRYDGMGILRKDFSEVKNAFGLAKSVDRVVFQLGTPLAYMNRGKKIDIHLDANDGMNCFLSVADDDEAWVDTTFRQLSTRLEQYANRNRIPHSALIELLIQFVGVFVGFFMCLFAAHLLAPKVAIQHSFFVMFVGFFLVFSNLWTYLLLLIGKLRNHYWPLISFKQHPLGLAGQTIIGFVLTGVLTLLVERSWAILKQAGTLVVSP